MTRSAIADLLAKEAGVVQDDTLYRCLDKLLAHKRLFFSCLRARWQALFGVRFEVLLYDLWEFERDGQAVNVRVEGQWVFSSSPPMLQAALAGFGLAFLPEDMALEHVAAGGLVRVLEDWCEPVTGDHLYYASRRQSSRALAVVLEALRYRR